MKDKGVRPKAIIKARYLSVGIIICLLVSMFFPKAAVSQEAVRFQKPLEHQVAVTLKLIQVYVTDKKGNPVQDLAKEDFATYDNGQEKKITEFEKHILTAPAATPEPQPPAEKAVTPPAPAPQKLTRKYFLFFDFAFNNPRSIKKAKDAALHFIDTQLQPTDEVGVLSYSALKNLTLHEYLTADRQKVRETVQSLGIGNGVVGRAEDVEEQYLRQDFGDTELDPQISHMQAHALISDRQDAKTKVLFFLTSMTDLAKALRYVPGQKNIVFFSSGIPASLLDGVEGVDFDFGDHRLRDQTEQLIKELSAANCTVFAFDTREAPKVASFFSYDEYTFGNQGRNIFNLQRTPFMQMLDPAIKDERLTGLYSLGKLSHETGGKYFGDINEYQNSLEQMKNLTGTYYVLGYSINEQWDGQYHQIKVEVKRKGCEIRAQAGYFNPKPFKEYSDLEKQLHLFDLALNDRPLFQTPMMFSMMPLSYAAGEETRLLMLSKIPDKAIEKFSGKKAELISLVFDEQENLMGLHRTETEFTKNRGLDVFYTSEAALQPGNYTCRLVIRDLDTGDAAVASARAHVAKKTFIGLSLHSPLLLVPESNFAYLETTAAKNKEMMEWKDAYPFDRAEYSPVVGEVPKSAAKILVVIPCSITGLVQPSVKIAAYLIDAVSGEGIPISFSILNKVQKDNLEIHFLEVPLQNVPPGKYLLYFHAEDAVSKAVSYAQTKLIIRQF
jgi:VWFA-related protein